MISVFYLQNHDQIKKMLYPRLNGMAMIKGTESGKRKVNRPMPDYAGRLLVAGVVALIPLLAVVLSTALDGHLLGSIYLPASEWNDELFYYKMTEGVLKSGIPGGFYGFNESRALRLSFAAWSPVILLPWIIWGKIFGWTLLSPVICNIVLLMIACFIYGYLVRPGWLQVAALAVCYCSFGFFARFTLSAMPEAIFFSMLIVYIACMVRVYAVEKQGKGERIKHGICLGIAILLAVLLTWMRPYYLLLLCLPLWQLVRGEGRRTKDLKGKVNSSVESADKTTEIPSAESREETPRKRKISGQWIRLIAAAVIVLTTLVIYWILGHFYSAEYLEDLYYTDWLKAFAKGPGAGFSSFFAKLRDSASQVKAMCVTALGGGHGYGTQYVCFLAVTVLQLLHFLISLLGNGIRMRLDRGKTAGFLIGLQLQLLCLSLAFFIADLLMYRLPQGGRHTMAMVLAGLFLFAATDRHMQEIPQILRGVVIASLCLAMTVVGAKKADPYLFANPYRTEALKTQVETLQTDLDGALKLDRAMVPSWENTVIWMISDYAQGDTAGDTGALTQGDAVPAHGDLIIQRWQLFYALPKGIGINLCTADYVEEHFDELHARYIGVNPGSVTEARCEAAGYKRIAETKDLRIYDRKNR